MANIAPIKLGVGVLLENEAFDTIRTIELALAQNSGNLNGLWQPPHITVKRPFIVTQIADIDTVVALLEQQCQLLASFMITFDRIENFSEKVLFAHIQDTKALQDMHARLVNELLAVFPDSKQPSEMTSDMIFHATLGLGLSAAEYSAAREGLAQDPFQSKALTTVARRLGLFMSDDGQHWSVIRHFELTNPTEGLN